MVKALETSYKGYRFRSRLEARWAVFFDSLGIRYEYEKEGFELAGGRYYLPDFWMPEWDCWIEIKGSIKNNEEKFKALLLAGETGKAVYMVEGYPDSPKYNHRLQIQSGTRIKGYFGYTPLAYEIKPSGITVGDNHKIMVGDNSFNESNPYWFVDAESTIHDALLYCFPNCNVYEDKRNLHFAHKIGGGFCIEPFELYAFEGTSYKELISEHHYKMLVGSYGTATLSRAYKAARSARFEFGESG